MSSIENTYRKAIINNLLKKRKSKTKIHHPARFGDVRFFLVDFLSASFKRTTLAVFQFLDSFAPLKEAGYFLDSFRFLVV